MVMCQLLVSVVMSAESYVLLSGSAELSAIEFAHQQYGLILRTPTATYQTMNYPFPVTLEVNGATLTDFYSKVEYRNNSMVCSARLTTTNGSQLSIKDAFSPDSTGFFHLTREIVVIKPTDPEEYFNSYFGWTIRVSSSINDFEFFVPGIWYKDNRYLTKRALANDFSDNYFYFREDRLPLPIVASRDKKNGTALSLMHIDAHPETFYGENGLHRIVDERMQFGSLGFVQTGDVSVQFVFPGIEGERTYTGSLGDKEKSFSYRSHPARKDIAHTYRLVFGTNETGDFASFVEKCWKQAWNRYNPPVHKMNMTDAYQASIEVLDAYLENVNGAPGWPFSIYLPNGIARAYNYQMGFIGFQLSNAAFLLRHGLETGNSNQVKRASEVVDFWVKESMTEHGLPKTWADANADRKHTWRHYETYMRTTAGGMEGMMSAWNTMKKHGINKPEWLNYCKTYANWLVENQEEDGSFYIRYRWEDARPTHDSKYTTTNVIRFLIELYCATSDEKYLTSALKAGEFSYDFIHKDYLYVGGVIDNPNVKDRESGQMAIYAFLALYDVTKEERWKAAAVQAARYTETFMFSYNVPMAFNDSLTDFPLHRDLTGFTLIATGHSGIDNGLSFSSFQYYRLYLLTHDKHFLHLARVIQNNTLQIMDLDGKMGFRYRGLLTECFAPQANRGHSVRQQLPWNQAAVLDPMCRFMDAFGEWDIDLIEQWPLEKKIKLMEAYAIQQGMLSE